LTSFGAFCAADRADVEGELCTSFSRLVLSLLLDQFRVHDLFPARRSSLGLATGKIAQNLTPGIALLSFSMPPSAASSALRQAGFAFKNARQGGGLPERATATT
jgi:hypothetical protein